MANLYRITVETKHVTRTLTALAATADDALSENQSWLIRVGGKITKVEQLDAQYSAEKHNEILVVLGTKAANAYASRFPVN